MTRSTAYRLLFAMAGYETYDTRRRCPGLSHDCAVTSADVTRAFVLVLLRLPRLNRPAGSRAQDGAQNRFLSCRLACLRPRAIVHAGAPRRWV